MLAFLVSGKLHVIDFVRNDFTVAFKQLLHVLHLYDVPKNEGQHLEDSIRSLKYNIDRSESEERTSLSSGISLSENKYQVEHDSVSVASSLWETPAQGKNIFCFLSRDFNEVLGCYITPIRQHRLSNNLCYFNLVFT